MRGKTGFSPPMVGGSSLLVIFAVLCLAVFALLSVSAVQAERRLADAAVRSVTDYYEADLLAEEIFARLRNGENPAGVRQTGDCYEFAVPVSDRQTLLVQLRRREDRWEILRWQAVTEDVESDDTLDVWKGTVKGS